MKMKDVNGIHSVSVREQLAIQYWYRMSMGMMLCIFFSMLICHGIQVYAWYLSTHGLCNLTCTPSDTSVNAECTTQNEQLAAARAHDAYIESCTHTSENWSHRLSCIHTIIPHIESLDITADAMECMMRCKTVDECMQIISDLSAQADIDSAVCLSMRPDSAHDHALVCTIRCQYTLHPVT